MARERKFSKMDLYQLIEGVLLEHGYEKLTFGLLAEKLNISRGAIYKYYENKDDLIMEYMVHKMHLFFDDLKQVKESKSFHEQFNSLFSLLFKYSPIVKILSKAYANPFEDNKKVINNKEKINNYHLQLYNELEDFVQLGKNEGILKDEIPNSLILAMIFQTIIMPNYFQVPEDEWVAHIKAILRSGMMSN